ncbi:MAG: ATP synthase F1 subunit gamma [Verrucomicrobiota bacterium]
MPSTRDIRRRIKSVKNTAKITKAMQMVAASKMSKAQQAAQEGSAFAVRFNHLMRSLSEEHAEGIEHPFFEKLGKGVPCYLVISTDKGLCGGLNTNLFRLLNDLPKDAAFVSVGKRGRQYVTRAGFNLLADFPLADKFSFTESKQISKFLIEKFETQEISSVTVVYSRFKNTLVQVPSELKLLPMQELSLLSEVAGEDAKPLEIEEQVQEYIFEPSPQVVFAEMLPYYVHYQIYQTFLNAKAAEHSARMVAMKNATENAKQLVKDLTLEYNKARQAAITNELLEITSAQMALG